MRPIAVLRPEPDASATAARAAALGLAVIRLRLFEVVPLAWEPPDPDRFGGLLITSANAVRHAGPGLARVAGLPVLAVGAATAVAAREAGLDVRLVGAGGVDELIAEAERAGYFRLLHFAGRDRVGSHEPLVAGRVICYASEAAPVTPDQVGMLAGSVALVHSARAAVRLAELVDRARLHRVAVRVAALSPGVAAALGPGWDRVVTAARPDDHALLAAALALAD